MGRKKVPHFSSVFLLKTSRSQMIRALTGPGLEDAEWQGIIQYTVLCTISQDECLVSAEGSSDCRSHTGAEIQAKNSSAKGNSLGAQQYQNQFMHRAHYSSTRKVRICQNKVGLERGRAELCQSTGGIRFIWSTASSRKLEQPLRASDLG